MTVDPTRPAFLLRLEGAAVVGLAVILFRELAGSWLLFAALFLAPDLSLIGYLGGARPGARVYNLAHTFVFPAALYAVGFVVAQPAAMVAGLIWGAHIGLDRLLGFGLKFVTGFRDTHLARVR